MLNIVQLIMEERPLTFGPIASPVCLGCHKTLQTKKVVYNHHSSAIAFSPLYLCDKKMLNQNQHHDHHVWCPSLSSSFKSLRSSWIPAGFLCPLWLADVSLDINHHLPNHSYHHHHHHHHQQVKKLKPQDSMTLVSDQIQGSIFTGFFHQ